jgi:hypothetical protein
MFAARITLAQLSISALMRVANSPACSRRLRSRVPARILKRRNKTWNDLAEFLEPTPKPSVDPRDAEPAPPTEGGVTVLDLVRAMVTDYVGLEPHEYTAVALWVIHTHIFDIW